MIELNNADAAAALFDRMSDGGRVTVTLKSQFWGEIYGNFTDRFGVQWAIIVLPAKA